MGGYGRRDREVTEWVAMGGRDIVVTEWVYQYTGSLL